LSKHLKTWVTPSISRNCNRPKKYLIRNTDQITTRQDIEL
jgi:hypothetical protein